MICPGTQSDCGNPGCRHGGCQGRLPQLPLFQSMRVTQPAAPAARETRAPIEEAEPIAA